MQFYAQGMRDREVIDSELRRLAAVRRSIREHGGEPSSHQVDELLDERLGHRAEASVIEAVAASETEVVDFTRYGRKRVLRRLGLLAALPLSLIAVGAVLVVMLAVHNPHPAAQPREVSPPAAPVSPPAASKAHAPPPAASKTQALPLDIVDKAFIDALTQEGVPVPSHDYVKIHGHAVCDFLAHQPNFAEAVHMVQQSSIWDANQSTDVVAGAIVSYCPQYEPASPDEMQQTFQHALSDLQAIEGDLQGIRDDLRAIPAQR
jgi:uncharacterized protein DUF732